MDITTFHSTDIRRNSNTKIILIIKKRFLNIVT